jgi:SAM-dependent methyltransferase
MNNLNNTLITMDQFTTAIKKQHGDYKREIFYRCYEYIPFRIPSEPTSILDLSCGHGNDLHKIVDAGYEIWHGVDIENESLLEARRRYEKKQQKEYIHLSAKFMNFDLANKVHQFDMKYDVACCNFAIHYYFKNETSLMNLLTTAYTNLKPGGYFFGTCMDGARLRDIGRIDESHQLNFTFLPNYDTDDFSQPFGHEYTFYIKDTAYFKKVKTSGSVEYLVDLDALIQYATRLGFKVKKTGHVLQKKPKHAEKYLEYLDAYFMFYT